MVLSLLWLAAFVPAKADPLAPVLSRVPGNGLQPQVAVDEAKTVHLLYFSGDPKGGDLFYTRKQAGNPAFKPPLRVNSQPGSAVAIGTIRGGQIVLGRGGRVHVVWNGSGNAQGHAGAPMYYARLGPGGGFEPQRDLITHSSGLDGGGSVAADRDGNVYVSWHGIDRPGDTESDRAVFLSRSRDDGQSFEPERRIDPDPAGACACCGLKIFADQAQLYLLYRAARGGTNRDELLLTSTDQGNTFRTALSDAWNGTTCPMSSAWLGKDDAQVISGWENRGRIRLSRVHPPSGKARPAFAPAGSNQKYPVTATDFTGRLLVAWVEGAGWQKGGTLAWQVFDSEDKAIGPPGHTNGVPVWSFAAAWARAEEGFEIIY